MGSQSFFRFQTLRIRLRDLEKTCETLRGRLAKREKEILAKDCTYIFFPIVPFTDEIASLSRQVEYYQLTTGSTGKVSKVTTGISSLGGDLIPISHSIQGVIRDM